MTKVKIKIFYLGDKAIRQVQTIIFDSSVDYRYLSTLYEVLLYTHTDFEIMLLKGDEYE